MGFTGGDILEITVNHPDLGSKIFYPKSAEDSTYDLGGFRSNDDANLVTGSGEMIDQMNNVRWSFETSIAWDLNEKNELDFLRKLAASPKLGEWTISHINGSVYRGTGKPVGDIQGNGNAATIAFKAAGGGGMKKIS